jgi:histone deacetylase complex subunit SAP18
VSFHTWPSATLAELSHQLAATASHLLPSPAIGTRLAFRLLYYDTRGVGDQDQGPARCVVKDLGSVVIGDGGPGISTDGDDIGGEADDGRLRLGATAGSAAESAKSLADVRFVVGDYLSCAILPPSSADGSVQPASAARAGRGYGAGQARSAVDLGPPPMSRGGGRDVWSAATYGPRGGGGGSFRAPPVGEWRRGEKLPQGPPGRGRGGRRW